MPWSKSANELLDCQGNWGNILTGDRAAAPRYIEVKLSKFALEVLFNAKTTTWLSSYDGRNKEPETLPVKFPLLLASGVDGITVGLACKILPCNFIELIDACIAHYQNKRFKLYPISPQAGWRTWRITTTASVEIGCGCARIDKVDSKTLVVREVPYGVTTGSLIDSILKERQGQNQSQESRRQHGRQSGSGGALGQQRVHERCWTHSMHSQIARSLAKQLRGV